MGENLRCGRVWPATLPIFASLHPILDRLLAAAQPPLPRVLELGAGMGLPGLWAAERGAEVVLTDSTPAVLELLDRNARALGSGGDRGSSQCTTCSARALDWRKRPSWLQDDFDLVIAADCLYEKEAVEPLMGVVAAALRPGGTLLLSYKERGLVDFDDALAHAADVRLSWVSQDSVSGEIEVHTFVRDY